MSHPQRNADLETLARMAARLAGYDPDRNLPVGSRGSFAYVKKPAWQHPMFMAVAEAAYERLAARPSAGDADQGHPFT